MAVLGTTIANAALHVFALTSIGMIYPPWTESTSARRRFIRTAALGATGSTLALLGTSFAFLLWPRRTSAVRGKIAVAAADVPAVNAPPFISADGRFFLVHNEDGVLALFWRCTYKGCWTRWTGPDDRQRAYTCPCYGCTFVNNGVRTDGPAPRPLDLMQLTVNGDGSVTVNAEAVSTRTVYSPDQAVPYPS